MLTRAQANHNLVFTSTMKFLFVALALLATATNAFVPTRALPRGVSRVTRGGAVNMVSPSLVDHADA